MQFLAIVLKSFQFFFYATSRNLCLEAINNVIACCKLEKNLSKKLLMTVFEKFQNACNALKNVT